MGDDSTPIPAVHGYWEAPSLSSKGDADKNAIFAAVGEATSSWEALENWFALTFGMFVESDSRAAVRAYGSIASHSGRREALENAAEICFDENRDLVQEKLAFGVLISHFRIASVRRNEIAHGCVTHATINEEDRGFFLVPAQYNSRKTAPPTASRWLVLLAEEPGDPFRTFGYDYRYTSRDIAHFTERFQALSRHVARLQHTLFLRYLRRWNQAGQERK